MFKWLKQHKLYESQSAGLFVMLDCMNVQKRHLEGIIEAHENNPKYHDAVVAAKGSLRALEYWQKEAQRVYDGTYLD